MHRHYAKRIAAAALFIAAMCVTVTPVGAQDQEPLQLLVVTGGGSYENTIFRAFDQLTGIEWTHATSDTEAFAEDIRGQYDVVLFYNLRGTLAEPAKTNLVNFLEAGKGVVVLHHALANYGDWEWWYKEVVGGRYLMQPDGDLPASTYRQGEEIVARPTKEHPVTARLGGFAFHMYDETYKGLWISPEVDVLLRTGVSTSDGPLVWVGPYDKSRVIAIQPGHSSGAHLNLAFRVILEDAILWAGQRL